MLANGAYREKARALGAEMRAGMSTDAAIALLRGSSAP